ncbi:MAG: hypothetical protein IKI34_00600 [Eubacterium sp.]|nr:hypothetical protein [Eubacterium sp.]MBR7060222.1 hypothetical protein [Eubacterium sp.]
MRAKEYGARPSRNVFSGGQQFSYDEFNREYKKVRYKSAEEYACRNVKEYHHYPEYKDLTSDDDSKNQYGAAAGGAVIGSALRTAGSAMKRRRMFQQVICIIAGSTIIVSTYQAMMKQQAQASPLPTPSSVVQETDKPVPTIPDEETELPQVASVEWEWNEDFTEVHLILYNSERFVIFETPAEISVSVQEPTCNKEGVKTYTAGAEYEGESYTDSKTEAIQPLGHSFDKGKDIVLDSGQSAKEFECARCHEHFRVATSSSEIDD